jgi:hypothetical protein
MRNLSDNKVSKKEEEEEEEEERTIPVSSNGLETIDSVINVYRKSL